VETKSGSYIYDGTVSNFHEWEFRTEMRITAALATGDPDKDTQYISSSVNKIVEGLRGDAFDMAMDIGKDKLLTKDGVYLLIKTIRSSLFPIEAQEAKVLFRVGQKPYGPMARQSGESMVSYISRRRRWWSMVKRLDTTMVLSDEMLGSLLLDHARLTPQENLMVLTATSNMTAFDKIKDVLILQHGRTHLKKGDSLGKGGPSYQPQPRNNYYPKKGKGKSKFGYYAGSAAGSDDWWYHDGFSEDHSQPPDYSDDSWSGTAMTTFSDEPWIDAYYDSSYYDDNYGQEFAYWTSPVDAASEELDLDIYSEMTSRGYTDEEASDAIQETLTANYTNKGKGKGKFKSRSFFPKGGKGKGPPPSLEDRKRRLAEIKAKT